MANFIDARGNNNELPIHVDMYRAARDNNMSLEQFLNTQYPTNAEAYGSTFHQVLASEGIFVRGDKEFGIRPSTMDQILNGRPRIEGGVITKDATPPSRILFPAAILTAIEDKLVADLNINPNAFDQMVAVDDSIQNDRFDRPILNYSNPEGARSQIISQLSMPTSMLSISVSEVTRKIPTRSLGFEISDQAVKATTLDLVALALARQRANERNERTYEYILNLLNGDPDQGMVALSTISNKVVKASSFDSSIVANGVLSQKAWMKWLFKNSTKRTITHIITDIDGALAVEGRTGKPTNYNDNPNSPRIDTLQVVMNPTWPSGVKVFITADPNWPANTIVGLDQRYGIHRVTSTTAAYEAIEAFVLKRSTAMRFDSGEIVYRLLDDAFEVLSLIA